MMIDEQAQNILLDAEIVGDYAKAAGFTAGSRFAHLLGPRRSGQINRAGVPHVLFCATHAAGQFLAGHAGDLFRLVNQLVRGCTVSGDHAAQRADFADMAHESACVDIPDSGNFVAIEIQLRGFRGAPVRTDLREFADD